LVSCFECVTEMSHPLPTMLDPFIFKQQHYTLKKVKKKCKQKHNRSFLDIPKGRSEPESILGNIQKMWVNIVQNFFLSCMLSHLCVIYGLIHFVVCRVVNCFDHQITLWHEGTHSHPHSSSQQRSGSSTLIFLYVQ